MDVRVRMVILGLIVGVLLAVVVASQGCGEHHPRKQAGRAAAGTPVRAPAEH